MKSTYKLSAVTASAMNRKMNQTVYIYKTIHNQCSKNDIK